MDLGNNIVKRQQVEREAREKLVQRERFLNMRHLPARMTPEEAAAFMGMSSHDFPILVANGLIKPLGNPLQSSIKWYAKVVLEELRDNSEWLDRATAILQTHWNMKNARRSKNREYSSLPQKERDSSRHSTAARSPSR
jgi:hypothetical protein